FVSGALASRVIARVVKPIVKRTATPLDERAFQRARSPLALFTALGVARALVPSIGLADEANETVLNVLAATFVFGVFWSLWRIVDLVVAGLAMTERVQDNPGARSLLSLGSKGAKVVLFVLGAITALGHVGVHLATLVTGLGIGGLAFALA